jgi:putrescine:ornithine antiporter
MSTHKKMGVIQLTILTVVNMMGSGIILLPSKLAQVGTISILSWLVTAVGSVALAYAFAKCGRYSKKGGGMGGYAEYSFGKAGNFMTNYTYGISLVIANVAIATTTVGYLTTFLQWNLSPVYVCLATIAILWLATIPNFWGASVTGKIGAVTVWGIILPIVGLSIFGWFWFDADLYRASWNPQNMPVWNAVTASISITLWAFLGLESACANTDAVENPEKNVPIAVLFGTVGTAIIYIASTNVIAGIVPNADLLNSSAPFGVVFTQIFNSTIGQIVIGMMIISCFGSLLGWQFTVAQVFKSSSDEGYFLPAFGKVTASNTPLIGMIILTVIQTLLTFMTISPSLVTQFNVLVNLAVVTNLVPYILSMAAVSVLLKMAHSSKKEWAITVSVAVVALAYSFYAVYGAGEEAVFWGAIVTFLGWVFYGLITSHKYDVTHKVEY